MMSCRPAQETWLTNLGILSILTLAEGIMTMDHSAIWLTMSCSFQPSLCKTCSETQKTCDMVYLQATGGSLCHFYNTPKGCWYGDNCRFIHDVNQNNSAIQSTGQRCKFFLTPAGCRFGDHCKFRHDEETVETLLVHLNTGTEDESVSLLHEKYEEETPEKEKWAPPNDTESPESGILHSSDGCTEEGEPDSEGNENEERTSDLWSGDDDDDDEDDLSGNKKKWETMKSEKGDREKPEIKEAKCGECHEEFRGDDAFALLRAHYMDKFMMFHHPHLQWLSKHYRFDHTTSCMICDKLFGRSKDLLRHIVDKSKQKTEDGEEHQTFLDVGVVLPFCYRDTIDHDDDKLMEELFLSLVHTYAGSDTDSEDEQFLNFMSLAHMLTKMPHAHILDMAAVDSSSDDGGMFGFSEDDCYELACQGIKPWDPEAGAALAVLNGYYDDY